MIRKMIPFFTEYKNTSQNYTLFLEKDSNRVYKAYHRKTNSFIYLLAFVFVLVILRVVNSVHLPMANPLFLSALVISGFIVSMFIGIFSYKRFTYEDSRELFITQNKINDYIIKGKSVLKTEIWIVAMISLVSIVLTVFFFITQSLILFIFILACFSLINVLIQRFPKERFKLKEENVK